MTRLSGPDLRRMGDRDVFHGEGAFWDDRIGALRHVDMLAGDVITLTGGAPERRHVGDVAAVVRHRRAGGYVVAVERGFALLDEELRVEREIPAFDDPRLRMNEGACDARGRFYVGSMAYDSAPGAGTLYRLDPDLTVHVAMRGVTVPNGLVWVDDGRTALHADTPARRVWAYDFDEETGAFGSRRPVLELERMEGLEGMPDGMALDAEGGLWAALYGGGAVCRFDIASGRLTDSIDVGVSNPTSCAFGGADGRTLFITTSREGLDEGAEPEAGLVVAVDVDVAGAPVHAFAG